MVGKEVTGKEESHELILINIDDYISLMERLRNTSQLVFYNLVLKGIFHFQIILRISS